MQKNTLSGAQKQQLVKKAVDASENAYVPYSGYHVGAALLATDDQVFTGCNVENAAYPATICAERTAVVKAVSEGVHEFSAIAIVTPNGGSPCGICRQVLNEFNPAMTVLIATAEGDIVEEMLLSDLLPLGFGPENLLPPVHDDDTPVK
jgi:cytidine deaminase